MEQGIENAQVNITIAIAIMASSSINIITFVIKPASLITTSGEGSEEEKLKGASIILSPTNPGQVHTQHDQHSHYNYHITQNILIIVKNHKYPAEFHNTNPILLIEGDDHIFAGAFMAGAAAEGGKSTVAVHTSL